MNRILRWLSSNHSSVETPIANGFVSMVHRDKMVKAPRKSVFLSTQINPKFFLKPLYLIANHSNQPFLFNNRKPPTMCVCQHYQSMATCYFCSLVFPPFKARRMRKVFKKPVWLELTWNRMDTKNDQIVEILRWNTHTLNCPNMSGMISNQWREIHQQLLCFTFLYGGERWHLRNCGG